jgi:hypothetical protein
MNQDYRLNSSAIGINTKDVFLNKFDITWAEGNPDQKEFTKLPIEKITEQQDDGSINYYYNNEFFRSDDFKKDHKGFHILFAGCSQTEGVGGNIEDIWTNFLYNKIKASNNVCGFYSIARAGYGWQKIISNFLVYIKKYGKPDFLFILLPNVGRMYEWENGSNSWTYKQKYPNVFIDTIKEKNEIGFSEEDYNKCLIDFKISWTLFEEFCKANNIKMLWSTWDQLDNDNFKIMGTGENYLEITDQEKMNKYFENYISKNKLKVDDLNRRDDHYGTLYNRYWADIFYKGVRARWEIK